MKTKGKLAILSLFFILILCLSASVSFALSSWVFVEKSSIHMTENQGNVSIEETPVRMTIDGVFIKEKFKINEEDTSEYMLTGLKIGYGKVIKIYRDGVLQETFRSNFNFDGTTKFSGEFDFYVGKTDTWVGPDYRAILTISSSSDELKDKIGLKDSEDKGGLKAQYYCSADLETGDKTSIENIHDSYKYDNDYENNGYKGIALVSGVHKFYAKTGNDNGHSLYVLGPHKTVYFFNKKGWGNIYAHYWKDSSNGTKWNGIEMASIAEHPGWYKTDVYDAFDNILFNNGLGGDVNQTSDLIITSDKLYYNGELWQESYVPVGIRRIYYKNPPADWGGNTPYIYVWNSTINNSYPGQVMTKIANTDWYYADISIDFTQLQFNRGYGGYGNQTGDLNIPLDQEECFYSNWGDLIQ